MGKLSVIAKKAKDDFKKYSKKKKTAVVASAIMVPVIVISGTLAYGALGSTQDFELVMEEYTVGTGDIVESISGSGSIEPINMYEVIAMVDGDVLADTFEEGDEVEKGEILYEIDSSEMESTIERASLTLQKAELTYAESVDEYNGQNVTSPISGSIEEIYVEKGQSINNGAQIAKIVSDDSLKLKVPFSTEDMGDIYVGQSVDVILESTFETLTGYVTDIYNAERVTDGYMTVSDVEITVDNPGFLASGTYATAIIGNISSQESAPLSGENEKIVLSQTSGIVSEIIAPAGSSVNAGTTILTLDNDNADTDFLNSQISVQESRITYENTASQLDDYTIEAPISGSIIEKNVKAGDTLDSTSTKETMTVIADMSTMIFEIEVDELDIADIKEGQNVEISVDALPDKSYTGVVDNIGINGTASGGVTTYPVTIVINEPEGLWPGMNASVEIITEEARDVLIVPINAVQRGNTVTLADGSTVNVEVGVSDASSVEIVSGLEEGDVIMIESIQSMGESEAEEMMMPGMSGGVMPGGEGMSGGSMPSGGGGGTRPGQ